MTTTTSNMPIASTTTTSINTTKIPASTSIANYEEIINNFEKNETDETNINSAQQLYTTLKAENQELSTTILNKIYKLNTKLDSSQISHLTQDAQIESTKINFLEKYLFLILKIIFFLLLIIILFSRTYKNVSINLEDVTDFIQTKKENIQESVSLNSEKKL
jgi:ATP-dependent Zn protease|tara:strand:- start:13269 stop:13754 length:486 start_codon:yes stop_codon:yes gene_type:complete